MSLPCIQIADLTVSRLICGGNPFSGISHQTYELDNEMKDFYTVERIKKTLRDCEQLGINSLVARADNHIRRMLREYWSEGGTIQWIGQTASEWGSLRQSIIAMVETGAKAVYLHGSTVDEMFLDGRQDELPPLLDLIHSAGIPAGIASHNPRVIRHIHAEGWEADFYVFSFYDAVTNGDLFLEDDRPEAVKLIQEVDKPCIGIKVLAAGRHDPKEAIKYAFENIKPTDAIAVGTFCRDRPDEMRVNASLCQAYGTVVAKA
jgi:hypothetical protein